MSHGYYLHNGRIAYARSIAVLRLSDQASETGLRGNNIHRSNPLPKILNSLLAAQKFPARSAGSSSQAIEVTRFSVTKPTFIPIFSEIFPASREFAPGDWFALDACFGPQQDAAAAHAVEVYVHRVRKQLYEHDAKIVIHTIRGVGYLLGEAHAL
jgi:Transcriptional regulatory protein, C terminal